VALGEKDEHRPSATRGVGETRQTTAELAEARLRKRVKQVRAQVEGAKKQLWSFASNIILLLCDLDTVGLRKHQIGGKLSSSTTSVLAHVDLTTKALPEALKLAIFNKNRGNRAGQRSQRWGWRQPEVDSENERLTFGVHRFTCKLTRLYHPDVCRGKTRHQSRAKLLYCPILPTQIILPSKTTS
jgi:hypothetical protein